MVMRNTVIGLIAWAILAFVPMAAAQTVLRLAHSLPAGSPWGLAAAELAQDVEARLTGKLKVSVAPGGQLGPPTQLVNLLRAGTVELALVPTFALSPYRSEFQVYEVPFLFEDLGAVSRFQASKAGADMLQRLYPLGLKGLAYWHGGMKLLESKTQITLPTDLKGKKLVVTDVPTLGMPFEKLGATVVRLPPNEVFAALQRGVVDGSDTTPLFLSQFRELGVKDFVTVTNHGYFGYVVAANAKSWSSLSPEARKVLEQSLAQITPKANRMILANLGEVIRTISTKRTLTTLSKDQLEAWRASVSFIWRDFAKTEANKDLLNAALAAGTGGGGQPCPADQCRCPNRTCSTDCCAR